MMDTDIWNSICECLSNADHSRRPDARDADCFGRVSMILFGDFKRARPVLIARRS